MKPTSRPAPPRRVSGRRPAVDGGCRRRRGQYGDKIQTNHPGPIEFYLLAAPLRVLGMSAGPLLTAAAINAGGAGSSRLWGPCVPPARTHGDVCGPGVLMLGGDLVGAGTAVLTDTLSSNMTMYSLLLLRGARVGAGRRRPPPCCRWPRWSRVYARATNTSRPGLIVLALALVAVGALAIHVGGEGSAAGNPTITGTAMRWSAAAPCDPRGVLGTRRPTTSSPVIPGNLTNCRAVSLATTPRPTFGSEIGASSRSSTRVAATDDPDPHRHVRGCSSRVISHSGASALGILVVVALAALAWGARARSALRSLGSRSSRWYCSRPGVVNGSNVSRRLSNRHASTCTDGRGAGAFSHVGPALGLGRRCFSSVGSSATRRIGARLPRLAPVCTAS